MVMRVGGLATGMDIEAMVNKLMEAERMPLNRLQQQKTMIEWQRDGYRDINKALLEIDEMFLNMKLSTTYNPKAVTSSQKDAVTATASSSATNGTYEINVEKLARNEMQVGGTIDSGIKLNEKIDEQYHGTHTITTYDKEGKQQEYEFTIKEGDTLKQVLQKISSDNNNVRAFFDEGSQRVVFETTRTGVYNVDENGSRAGNEMTFGGDSDFFAAIGMNSATVTSAENAKFTYNNGLDIESRDNSYNINGINLQFHNVTEGNARLSVTTDVEDSFKKITDFVEKYNKAVELMNTSQIERKQYNYKPLLEEQKEEMTEEQIKKWEDQAKKGILRGDTTIQFGLSNMRQSLYSKVDTGGEYTTLSQVGITTSANYLDGGKLVIDEDKLKAALRDNPEDVQKLFSNSAKDDSRGLINRLEDQLKVTKSKIEDRAGKDTHSGLDSYSLGKQMKGIDDRISDFERKMLQVEQRYWNQFTQMEKAIARLNDQSAQLFSQFGA